MRGVRWCAVLSVGLVLAGAGRSASGEPMTRGAQPVASGAQPSVTNARLETVAASGSLTAALRPLLERAATPQWVAWVLPAEGRFTSCCWESSGCPGCRLEPAPAGTVAAPLRATSAPLALEGDAELIMLVRLDERRIDRVRMVGITCPVDGGGLPFVTLTGVKAADSLVWLRSLIDGVDPSLTDSSRTRRLAESAIHAIARHADPGAVPMLLDLARRHAEPRVRGSALVALAQAAGRRVAPDLLGAIENDPDTEVKKRAVFGLSQLPKDESVPRLIRLAREHQNPAVRRQAMFWLGQSKDPRAVEFFAAILK
jgi:hypothetical protein